MLDENLPNFFLKANIDGVKHHQCYFFSQHGSEPEPTYDLRHLDPAASNSANTYATALFDSHNPDVLFGEVLLRPGWTQPTLSQEEIRRNGGVAPPPQPILPTNFAIQLYEPDQQVEVTQKSSTWSSGNWYEFSMPQRSFRTPSGSDLDRSRNDPAADATIPKLNFVWRRDGRLSKDLTCFLTGKSTDSTTKKKKHKEPDIAIAMFSDLRDMTIVESNLHRVEMEDYKGLEVVLLLSAAVLRDVYFGEMKEAFHIADAGRKNSGGLLGKKGSSPLLTTSAFGAPQSTSPTPYNQSTSPYPRGSPPRPSRNDHKRQSLPPLQTNGQRPPQSHPQPQVKHNQPPRQPAQVPSSRPPPADPRTQWQIDAETARLRAESDAQSRAAATHRREQSKADEAEARRLRKVAEQEAAQKLRAQAKIDRETEKLRRKYGTQAQFFPAQQHQQQPTSQHHRHTASAPTSQRPQHPQQRPQPAPSQHRPHTHTHQRPAQNLPTIAQGRIAQPTVRPSNNNNNNNNHHHGAFLQPSGSRPAAAATSQPQYFGGGGLLRPDIGQTLSKPKRSFFGLKSGASAAEQGRLSKKQSSLF